jgi:FkbM family methyltransferase
MSFKFWRKRSKDKATKHKLSPYDAALQTLLASRERVRIVQIGANDGSINDPVYKFVKHAKGRTEILLVEPQENLIPYLRESYAFHPDATIIQAAVGPPGTLDLYAVDRAYWSQLKQIDYAHDWPEYRAPTGVTSAERAHVHKWLKEHLKKPDDADKAIRKFQVPCMDVVGLLAETGFDKDIDVLQIDTEGFDDTVIYNANLDLLKPAIINFEGAHLPNERLAALTAHLQDHCYYMHLYGMDALAIRCL